MTLTSTEALERRMSALPLDQQRMVRMLLDERCGLGNKPTVDDWVWALDKADPRPASTR